MLSILLIVFGNGKHIKYHYKVIGEENTIIRGQQLADFLDNILEIKPQEKPDNKSLIPDFVNVSEAVTANEAV